MPKLLELDRAFQVVLPAAATGGWVDLKWDASWRVAALLAGGPERGKIELVTGQIGRFAALGSASGAYLPLLVAGPVLNDVLPSQGLPYLTITVTPTYPTGVRDPGLTITYHARPHETSTGLWNLTDIGDDGSGPVLVTVAQRLGIDAATAAATAATNAAVSALNGAAASQQATATTANASILATQNSAQTAITAAQASLNAAAALELSTANIKLYATAPERDADTPVNGTWGRVTADNTLSRRESGAWVLRGSLGGPITGTRTQRRALTPLVLTEYREGDTHVSLTYYPGTGWRDASGNDPDAAAPPPDTGGF